MLVLQRDASGGQAASLDIRAAVDLVGVAYADTHAQAQAEAETQADNGTAATPDVTAPSAAFALTDEFDRAEQRRRSRRR